MAVEIKAILTASISDFKAKLNEAEVSMKTMTDSGSSTMSKMSSIGKGALLGIGAAIVGVGIAAVDFGDKLEVSQNSLQAALKAAGISWDSVKGSVSATGEAATRYGFTQAQVDSALALGVISTQSYSSAHKNLAVAVELAAAKHVDLNTAMQAVDKATQGNTRALMQLGISLPIASSSALKLKQAQDALSAAQLQALSYLHQFPDALDTASSHHAAYEAALNKVTAAQGKLKDQQAASGEILDALSKRLKGQASAAADTFAGRIAAVKAQGENLVAQIGMRLIPVLERMMTIVMSVVTWLEHHKDIAIAVGIALGTLVTALEAVTAAEWAMSLTPVGAIVAAIVVAVGLLVVGIYELSKHWHQVWTDIKNWTADAVAWIKDHMLIVMNIPIVGWLLVLAANWKSVFEVCKAAVMDAWSVIQPIFNFVRSAIVDQVQAAIIVFQAVWQATWSAVQTAISAASAVIGAISAAISFAIGAVETVVSAIETAWDTAWGAVKTAVKDAWDFIRPIFDAIKSAAQDVANVVGAVGNAINTVGGVAKNVVTLGGLLAGGGPASANVPYIVGEDGPELFIPSASGVVVPNGAFGPGMGGTSISSGGGGASGGGPMIVNLIVNGQTFASAISDDMWTAFLQKKRSVVTLNLN